MLGKHVNLARTLEICKNKCQYDLVEALERETTGHDSLLHRARPNLALITEFSFAKALRLALLGEGRS